MKLNENRLWLHIKHDIRVGIGGQWIKYFASAVIFAILSGTFLASISHLTAYATDGTSILSPSFGDFLISQFRGMREFDPHDKDFQINVLFLLTNLFLAFIVSFYPFKDLSGYGQKMLLASQKRSYWWISKCIWNILSVLCYYLTAYMIIAVFALFSGGFSLLPHRDILSLCYSISLPPSVNSHSVLWAGILLPILASISISLFQMTIALIFKPILGMIITAAILVASIFYSSPWLPGCYLMAQRNSLILPESGIDPWKGLLLCIAISVISSVVGLFYFKNYDILTKSD